MKSNGIRWVFPCKVESTPSVASLYLTLDMGLHVTHNVIVKLAGIIVPRYKDDKTPASASFVSYWLKEGMDNEEDNYKSRWPFLVETIQTKDRWVWHGAIWRCNDMSCLNRAMVTVGVASLDMETDIPALPSVDWL